MSHPSACFFVYGQHLPQNGQTSVTLQPIPVFGGTQNRDLLKQKPTLILGNGVFDRVQRGSYEIYLASAGIPNAVPGSFIHRELENCYDPGDPLSNDAEFFQIVPYNPQDKQLRSLKGKRYIGEKYHWVLLPPLSSHPMLTRSRAPKIPSDNFLICLMEGPLLVVDHIMQYLDLADVMRLRRISSNVRNHPVWFDWVAPGGILIEKIIAFLINKKLRSLSEIPEGFCRNRQKIIQLTKCFRNNSSVQSVFQNLTETRDMNSFLENIFILCNVFEAVNPPEGSTVDEIFNETLFAQIAHNCVFITPRVFSDPDGDNINCSRSWYEEIPWEFSPSDDFLLTDGF